MPAIVEKKFVIDGTPVEKVAQFGNIVVYQNTNEDNTSVRCHFCKDRMNTTTKAGG